MEYSAQKLRDIQTSYSQKFRNRLLMIVPFVILLLLFAFLARGTDGDVLGIGRGVFPYAIVVLGVLAASFSLYNWRCPACKRFLGRTLHPRFCPRCGVQLRDSK